jgi:hypothetical protein
VDTAGTQMKNAQYDQAVSTSRAPSCKARQPQRADAYLMIATA